MTNHMFTLHQAGANPRMTQVNFPNVTFKKVTITRPPRKAEVDTIRRSRIPESSAHPYEPDGVRSPLHTDPMCRACSQPKSHYLHTISDLTFHAGDILRAA
jgi:hypothetical protein